MEAYRKIAEDYFEKRLLPDEVVHHIDGNRANNDKENLVIMKSSQHLKMHGSLFCALDNWKAKIRITPCNTCLYVKKYERDIQIFPESLFIFADTLMNWGSVNREHWMLDVCYESCLEWKSKHGHDCYENKGMNAIKGS